MEVFKPSAWLQRESAVKRIRNSELAKVHDIGATRWIPSLKLRAGCGGHLFFIAGLRAFLRLRVGRGGDTLLRDHAPWGLLIRSSWSGATYPNHCRQREFVLNKITVGIHSRLSWINRGGDEGRNATAEGECLSLGNQEKSFMKMLEPSAWLERELAVKRIRRTKLAKVHDILARAWIPSLRLRAGRGGYLSARLPL